MRGAASSTWRPPRSSVQEPAASTLRTQSPVGDVLDLLEGLGGFQLVFAGAQGGKWIGLDQTIAALRPGGLLVVDDMRPAAWIDEEHLQQTAKVRQTLLQHPGLTAVELQWASDVIIAAKRHADRSKLKLSTARVRRHLNSYHELPETFDTGILGSVWRSLVMGPNRTRNPNSEAFV